MNIDINLIKKKNFKNYNNKKMNRIIKRYERIINKNKCGTLICYYNKENELIVDRLLDKYDIYYMLYTDLEIYRTTYIYNEYYRWYKVDEIKEKLINDINKEKFKMSIHYMKKKLPDEIIYEISTYL